MPLTKREGSENHGRHAGRYYGKIDGKLNAATMAAVRSFQQAKGLPTSGPLTIETLQVLGVKTGG
jgi:peptidoglycan hydrolase-like protein with peptidoglycan-binding domain